MSKSVAPRGTDYQQSMNVNIITTATTTTTTQQQQQQQQKQQQQQQTQQGRSLDKLLFNQSPIQTLYNLEVC